VATFPSCAIQEPRLPNCYALPSQNPVARAYCVRKAQNSPRPELIVPRRKALCYGPTPQVFDVNAVDCGMVRLVGAVALTSLVGCSEVIDIPDDPRLVNSGPWWCLDRPRETVAPKADTALVRIQACNFISTNCSETVTGLSASLCDKKDVTCANPIQTTTADSGGVLALDVQTGGVLGLGFDGYLKIAPPLELCTNQAVFGASGPLLCGFAPGCDQAAPDDRCKVPLYAPSSLFFNPPIKNDVVDSIPLPLVPTSAVLSLVTASGAQLDPTAGLVFVTAHDCNDKPASGVSFNLDKHQDRVTVLYLENGLISSTATATDSNGLGGIINVPSGFVSVEGSIETTDGTRRPMGAFGVQVATFNISYSTLAPSP